MRRSSWSSACRRQKNSATSIFDRQIDRYDDKSVRLRKRPRIASVAFLLCLRYDDNVAIVDYDANGSPMHRFISAKYDVRLAIV